MDNNNLYTSDQIINWFIEKYGIKKTRKRTYIDPRNYVIAVLYQKFNYTEENIAPIFNLDRSSVNHAKKHAKLMLLTINDFNFIENTKEIVKKYPFDFQTIKVHYLKHIVLTDEYYKKLEKAASKANVSITLAAKLILHKYLDDDNKV